MTYSTGNALGSTDPRDLYDNAENLDKFVNGAALAYPDRLGASRKSWKGMEQDFQNFLLASGYQDLGAYAAGLNITARNQVFDRSGLLYRLASSQALPYTTTGSWAGESGKFVVITDASLRTELANGGSALVDSAVVGYGAGTVEDELARIAAGGIPGAAGNGVADDTSAFAAFEASVSGRAVDLGGKTYLVTAIPTKNAYYNGSWKIGGFTRSAQLADTFLAGSPSFHPYGGQLRKLAEALADPLVQYLGIVFIGDSITWGTGTGESPTPDPRDGTLSDPRDYYGTPSYVNQIKRYIQQRYAPLSTPIITNWSASPSGESIVEYRATHIMYPRYGDFTVTQAAGSGLNTTDVNNRAVIGGGQLQLSSGNVSVLNSHTVTFQFTGTEFKLYFACVDADATFYDLLVDGALIGTYSTHAGAVATSGTLINGTNNNYNTHTFSYVKNKTITIRTNRNGESGNRICRLQAVEVNKRIVISNQGINGATFKTYYTYNLSGGYGDGVAVAATDSFVFVQLGTNDRLIPGANQYVRGPNVMQGFAETLIGMIPATADTILMAANPSSNESSSSYWFSMREVRDTIIRLGKKLSLDVIDNYSAFSGMDVAAATSDGVHPNRIGMQIIARNIINSLESA